MRPDESTPEVRSLDDWRDPDLKRGRESRYDWALAKRMWDAMRPASEIIRAIGCGKQALYGTIHRHGWRDRRRIMPVRPVKPRPPKPARIAYPKRVREARCQNFRGEHLCNGAHHISIAGVDLCEHCYGVVMQIAADAARRVAL